MTATEQTEDLAQLLRRVREGSTDAEVDIIEMFNARRKELASLSGADLMIRQVEERFPNWKFYRDLVDCIDVTLHDIRRAPAAPALPPWVMIKFDEAAVVRAALALFRRDVEEDVCDGTWEQNAALHLRILADARAALEAAYSMPAPALGPAIEAREGLMRAATIVANMRQDQAALGIQPGDDPKYSGQRGCDRSDALYEAYQAIMAAIPEKPPLKFGTVDALSVQSGSDAAP